MRLCIRLIQLLCFLLLPLGNATLLADDKPLVLYIDADNSVAWQSTQAILRGVNLALAEHDHKLMGFELQVKVSNHRGNSARSRRNLEDFLADPQGLLVFSGLHSPPLLSNLQFINEQRILLLDPWAAAAPITRGKSAENWIYRLSVDDSKAGELITGFAVEREGFQRPYLLLENTGWGRSNEKNMTLALNKRGITPVGTGWFNWSLSQYNARSLLREAMDAGADVIFLVANAPEGKMLMQAMAENPGLRIPVRSHWGITGGAFAKQLKPEARRPQDLKFIQSSFSFVSMDSSQSTASLQLAKKVMGQIQNTYDDVNHAEDIVAPTGLIHAYDLTRIAIAAIQQAGLTGDVKQDRVNIRQALESLQAPVVGLIKTYRQPFLPYSVTQPDAHEALSSDDLRMAHFNLQGIIVLEQP